MSRLPHSRRARARTRRQRPLINAVVRAALFETQLTVRDLDRSIVAFSRDVLGLTVAFIREKAPSRSSGPAATARRWLGLWAAGATPIALSLHVAFATTLEDMQAATPLVTEDQIRYVTNSDERRLRRKGWAGRASPSPSSRTG